NAELARHLYPGWVVRFYVDDTVPLDITRRLWELETEVVEMPRNHGIIGKLWRLLIADERGFARWLVRDVESRLNYRERRAVDEWIASGAPFHVMRDHPNHQQAIPAFGCGGICGVVENMRGRIVAWPDKEHDRQDEMFLETVVWPQVKDAAL